MIVDMVLGWDGDSRYDNNRYNKVALVKDGDEF